MDKIAGLRQILNRYIKKTRDESKNLRVAIVASIVNETSTLNDFPINSVTTSYLSRKETDRLIRLFRENDIYVELYNDVEKFFKAYYSDKFTCNAIFESSPKGIAKGKDALLPAFCDTVNLMHFGPNAAANLRVCNKYGWFCTLMQNGVPVPQTYLFNNGWLTVPTSEKILLKLNEECASIGLSTESLVINDKALLTQRAQNLQDKFNEPVIGQQFVSGYEVEVPILCNRETTVALPAVGLSLGDKRHLGDSYFGYDEILDDGYGVYLFETVDDKTAQKLQDICLRVAKVLDLQGHFRIDFRISSNGDVYVTDINNDPTIGLESSFLFSVNSLGYNEKDLVAMILGNYLVNRTKTECQ